MKANVSYDVVDIGLTQPEIDEKGWTHECWLCMTITDDDGRELAFKKLALFNLDSEAEGFHRWLSLAKGLTTVPEMRRR